MGLWSDLIGTVRGYILLGVGGVRLKNSSGALSVRNTADSADAQVVASSLKADAWYNSNGTENFKCRAWVNFDATGGTISIRASGNVASVTRNATGDYTVNFSTAMPDTYYIVTGMVGRGSGDAYFNTLVENLSRTKTTGSAHVFSKVSTGALEDCASISVAIFR